MNSTQLKYARERAKTIFDTHKDRITAKHTTTAVNLSSEETRRALRDSRFVVKEASSRQFSNGYLHDYVDLLDEVRGSVDTAAIAADMKTLTTDYNALIDELVLGDCEVALKRLSEFAAPR